LEKNLNLERSCIEISKHLICKLKLKDTSSIYKFYSILDSTSQYLQKCLGEKKDSLSAVDSILDIVYNKWNITFNTNDTILETLLPHLVYYNKSGACLGVSLIILLIAEKISCPIYGVILPGHFFCRFDNGKKQINIEPNKRGYNHSNEYYINKYLNGRKINNYMQNISPDKTVGMLCYNSGIILMKNKEYKTAQQYFIESTKILSDFLEGYGNLALCYAYAGNLNSSIKVFEYIYEKNPFFENLILNYGNILLKAKKFNKAYEIFKMGLYYNPNDTLLLNGLYKAKTKIK